MKRRFLRVLTVLVLGAVMGTAWAQETKGTDGDGPAGTQGQRPEEGEGLKVTTSVKRQVQVVDERGERQSRLEDVTTAVPGEELVMVTVYENRGKEPARNVALVNAVPAEMTYVGGSAHGDDAAVDFSVDGGTTFDRPENLFIVQADGTKRPAEPAEYTHLRWLRKGPLAAEGRGETRFRVLIK